MASEQQMGIWKTVAFVVTLVLIFVGGFFYKMTRPPVYSDAELAVKGVFLFKQPRELDDFELVTGLNKPFTRADFSGHWSFVFFGFTFCPDICPTTMATLNSFYSTLSPQQQQRTNVYLVSVDPARDTPEKLTTYVKFFNADFYGITGEFLTLKKLATQLNIPFSKVPGGGDNYLVDHSGNVAILNPRGHYVGFIKAPIEADTLQAIYPTLQHRY